MRPIERARFAREAEDEGFEGDWMTDSEDDDRDEEEEHEKAALASASPPSGVDGREWVAYKATVRAVGFARARPPRPALPVGRGVPPSTTSRVEVAEWVNHANTRCVNVKQPWATLIALGLKDVENRSQRLPHNSDHEPYCWVAIVASAVDPSKDARQWGALLRDVDRRVWWNGGYDAVDLPTVPREKRAYPSQSVVAMAKLACSAPKARGAAFAGKQSVWNNGDTYAWEVLEVHPLARPVWFGNGFQTPAVYLTPRGNAKEAHAEAMRRVRDLIRRELLHDAEEEAASLPASFDRLGCAALPLAETVDAPSFLAALGEGTRAWFHKELEAALAMDPQLRHARNDPSADTLAEQFRIWHDEYTRVERAAVLRALDPSTTAGLTRIFDDAARRGHVPAEVAGLLTSRIRYVKQGNAFMGLGSMHLSWSRAGFGKWARIHPGIGLTITSHVLAHLRAAGFAAAHVQDNLPHLIYKPPSGDKLPCHHDAMPPRLLLERLRSHRESTMTEWARAYGVQTLCHVEGGVDDGYTYVMGPMTPKKLLVCVEALWANEVPGAFENAAAHAKWKEATAGPYFADWNKPQVLKALNARLALHGETAIKEIPVRPSGARVVGAYVAMWPIGVPHGSSKNKTRRVTITLPLSTTPRLAAPARAPGRLRALATLAASDAELRQHGVFAGTPQDQRAHAESLLARDTRPFADGATHVKPEYAAEYVRHVDGAGRRSVGPYASIAPTLPQVRDYLKAHLA